MGRYKSIIHIKNMLKYLQAKKDTVPDEILNIV